MSEDIIITRDQLRILLEGLMVWNTEVVDSLSDRGRKKLYKAQDLVESLWTNNK